MRQAMLDNVLIDLNTLTRPEIANLNGKRHFSCVKCAKPVIFKNGTRKQSHFAHEKNGVSVGRPESATHILVKHSLARWLERQGCTAMIERRFPEIDRIADVYFEYKNRPYALEIQKSPISDTEYQQRMDDYQRIGIIVLWIFVGNLEKKENVYKLPPVMVGRNSERLLHFCVKTAALTVLERPVYITNSRIYARAISKSLHRVQVENLVSSVENRLFFEKSWLKTKRTFRERGWYHAGKSERKLIEQCLLRGFNLALVPTEVGWPVAGNAIKKPLFIWQTYVLVTLLKYFRVENKFTLARLMQLLEFEFKLSTCADTRNQVGNYLEWLVMFGILSKKGRYYLYRKSPDIISSMEDNISRDERYVNVVTKLWKR